MRAIHTPGHRPEHTAFALIDTARGGEDPWAVLTGDTLFVGDVARPDLAVEREEGARDIYRSLHGKLLGLPAEAEVWPGHLGGSLCGGPGMDMKVSSTIGFERAHNDLLGIDDEERFVERAIATLGPQPPNFKAIVDVNRGPLVSEPIDVRPLTPRQLLEKQRLGALVVDVRTALQFDEAHVPGAVSIPSLQAGFGSKLAWIAERDQDIAFIGRDDEDAERAGELAAAVAVTRIAGILAGGMTSWREEKRTTESIERLTVEQLHERVESNPETQILDVREASEWETGRIPDSVHVPYHDIHGWDGELDRARPIAAICSSGQRSGVAASLLQHHGAERVLHVVDGGIGTWGERGWPIAS